MTECQDALSLLKHTHFSGRTGGQAGQRQSDSKMRCETERHSKIVVRKCAVI